MRLTECSVSLTGVMSPLDVAMVVLCVEMNVEREETETTMLAG
jgi:hypothetical protein